LRNWIQIGIGLSHLLKDLPHNLQNERQAVLHFDALIALEVNFARYAEQYGTALLSV